MRIFHLLNHTCRMNGHVHAAIDLACAQVRLGHSAAMASRGGDFDDFLAANNVEIMQVNFERRPAALLKSLYKLQGLVRGWRADVVHAHMMTSAVLAWPVCQLVGVPLVTTVHNEFEKSSILMGLGTRVIAVSEAVGRSMRERGIPASRLDVVLNGTIGAARFAGRDRSPRRLDSPAVVFVGGLHPRKGLLDLFAAWEIVHAQNQTACLYIVGDGPHRAEYMNFVDSMNCRNSISFLGARDDAFQFLLGADVFVLPSLADPAPLVLSEAREAGCAVVATDVDGIPELLEKGKAGIIVPARDPAAFATAVLSLIQDPATLRQWREKSQFNIDYLRIDRVARETLKTYAAASDKFLWRSPRRASIESDRAKPKAPH